MLFYLTDYCKSVCSWPGLSSTNDWNNIVAVVPEVLLLVAVGTVTLVIVVNVISNTKHFNSNS